MAGDFGRVKNEKPLITYYPADEKRGTVIIFPGGGYDHVSVLKEVSAIAEAFHQQGINAYVLEYHVAPHPRSVILADAVNAVRWVREQCCSAKRKLALMGFSAGGHLALTETQHWQDVIADRENVSRETFSADALILCYPVVTFREPFVHQGSRRNFLGAAGEADEKLIGRYSAESHITPDFPPVFFWHCEGDSSVPIENSLMLRDALLRAGVSHKFLSFPGGAHGLGLAADDAVIRQWFPECVKWLTDNGF